MAPWRSPARSGEQGLPGRASSDEGLHLVGRCLGHGGDCDELFRLTWGRMMTARDIRTGGRQTSGMSVGPEDLKRWRQNFEEGHRRELAALRAEGPRPEWAISVSLSLIDAARHTEAEPANEAKRLREGEVIQARWARLRAALS